MRLQLRSVRLRYNGRNRLCSHVCDAFAAAHRDQPTLCGFEQVLPSAMGRLFEKEYCVISELMESPERPCTFILGGAKVDDKGAGKKGEEKQA